MKDSRERMLLEMGVGPLWKLRAPLLVDAPSDPAAAAQAAVLLPGRASLPPAERAADVAGGAPAAAPEGDTREARIARMDWPALKSAVAQCTACALCKTRKNTVFGVGDEAAEWIIVGEAPGAEEDARGEPFVGQAGQLLDAMLAALDMRRGQGVYIANVLKCRPPGNRNPDAVEVERCAPHLMRQVALIRPKLILLMGRFAAHSVLNTDASIASLRGRVHSYQGTPVVVSYHPAYLLRALADKSKAWEDLLFARATARRLQNAAAATSYGSQ